MKGKSRRKPDHAAHERENLILMGDAARTEYMRRVRCGNGRPGMDDSPLYESEYRDRRYSHGGLHDRLRQAAKRSIINLDPLLTAYQLQQFRCFIGYRRSYCGEC